MRQHWHHTHSKNNNNNNNPETNKQPCCSLYSCSSQEGRSFKSALMYLKITHEMKRCAHEATDALCILCNNIMTHTFLLVHSKTYVTMTWQLLLLKTRKMIRFCNSAHDKLFHVDGIETIWNELEICKRCLTLEHWIHLNFTQKWYVTVDTLELFVVIWKCIILLFVRFLWLNVYLLTRVNATWTCDLYLQLFVCCCFFNAAKIYTIYKSQAIEIFLIFSQIRITVLFNDFELIRGERTEYTTTAAWLIDIVLIFLTVFWYLAS